MTILHLIMITIIRMITLKIITTAAEATTTKNKTTATLQQQQQLTITATAKIATKPSLFDEKIAPVAQ